MKNIAKIGIIFMVALLAACQSEYDVIENGVFLTDAQKSQSKKVKMCIRDRSNCQQTLNYWKKLL